MAAIRTRSSPEDLITTICLYAYRFSDAPSYLVRHLPRSDHYYYIFSTLYEFWLTPVVSNSFLFHTLQKLISTDMLSLASDCNSLNTQLNLFSFMCCLGTFQFVFYKIAIFSVLLCNMTFVYVQSIYCRLLFCYLVIFIVFSSVIKYQNGMYNSMKLFNE